MKIKVIISLFVLAGFYLLIISAGRSNSFGPFNPAYLAFPIPKGWPEPPQNIFAKNRLTEQGFQLGKKLFYDNRLSADKQVSCATCHQPFSAFATFDHDLSHGVNNSFTTRNAPALMNLAWMTYYHWDGGINHLEVQPLGPLTAPNEMGASLDSVLLFLQKDQEYPKMFKVAFGDARINSQRMLRALAQFTGSLITANSKYDRVMNGLDTFTRFEAKGYAHFKAFCASCHKEPLFTDNSFRNNGMKLNRFNDAGRMRITGLPADSLKFKVPSLRNVQLTFPYMHDGSVFSVPQVIDHYIQLNQNLSGLDTALQKPIKLSKLERNELTYFLYTLTDTSFTKSKRFNPDGPVFYLH